MKKKIIIPIVVILLALLFVPIPHGAYDDGGTREYTALTYKIIDWNRLHNGGTYEKTRIYFGSDKQKSLDELWVAESEKVERSFNARILEVNGSYVLVEPLYGAWERYSADRVTVDTKNLDDIGAEVGTIVEIRYVGGIMETYPAQINEVSWCIAKDLREMEFEGEWLDKTTAEYQGDESFFTDIVISEIYADCFFAYTVIPMPYTIKLNGTLSDEWCVGDQVICEYENVYYDGESHKVECDFTSVSASDWQPEPGMCYKPVIYLYPEATTDVEVDLSLDGKLTCTYPAYKDGWRVTASPDGTLVDEAGKTYNYLYWEGLTNTEYDMTKGFCVRGEDTAEFLEVALEKLGLNRREANEFIVFWLPLMQENPYNIISFQKEEYTDSARLEVEPEPDTTIRVFMAYTPSENYVEIPEQTLTSPLRDGFCLVEWGGAVVK